MVTIPLDCNAIISEWMLAFLSNCTLYMQHHIYYYTPLPLNLANNKQQQQQQQHVSLPFWPLLRPNALNLLPM